MSPYRLHLEAIEATLRTVQHTFPAINGRLEGEHDPMGDEVVEYMLAGYAFVNTLLDADRDPFALGHSGDLIELNTLALCGRDPARRQAYAEHIRATAERFYDEPDGGIREVADWYARHRGLSPWMLAAGIHIRILAAPQLYIEGNHRTGALIMSYLLARAGQPPFVLSVDNIDGYFAPSRLIRRTRRRSLAMLVRMPGVQRRFARFLAEHADRRHLTASSATGKPLPSPAVEA